MAEINLEELNRLALENEEKMINDAETEYETKIMGVAKRIAEDDKVKLILLAGPSGSGKTTTANLICDAIKSIGEEASVISLDDFYRDQDDPEYPRHENGERDYECPEALNLPMLTKTLEKIVNGEEFYVPKYDFKLGRCVGKKRHDPLGHECIIIEGLHALNPRISDNLPSDKILKIFVSVSTNVNNNGKRILSGRKMRFIRRLVRDNAYRGSGVERTLAMWIGVMAAENVYLYPYKTTADLAFNTFHTFELGAMKKYAEEIIPTALAEKDPYLSVILNAVTLAVPVDSDLIPKTSLIREFITGGIYEDLY